MKIILLALSLFCFRQSLNSQYNFYRGNMHSHTAYSDGNKESLLAYDTPTESYNYAKNALQFDFLGVSEHNHALAGMNLANYSIGKNEAAFSTSPTFLAMYGIEWGTISGGGHVIIYGIDSLMGWEFGNYSIYTPYGDYDGLFSQIASRPNAFAYLAHPSTTDFDSIFLKPVNPTNDIAIIGTAVRSGPAFSMDTTYTNPSNSSYYARYKQLLGLGYHVGPTLDHDNHYTTFGKTTPARTVVLATALSELNIMNAYKNRRFYATDDWNIEVNFTMDNTYYMGEIVSGLSDPTFQVSINDPDVADNIDYIRLRGAIAGGGAITPPILLSTTTNSLSYTHVLTPGVEYFYYLEIKQIDGDMSYTAPIWYTKATPLPIELISFLGYYDQKRVVLNWETASESNSDYFVIEKSENGSTWELLENIEAATNSNELIKYESIDYTPSRGLNYYRLTQFDLNGVMSEQRLISVQTNRLDKVDIYPNPSSSIIYFSSKKGSDFTSFEVRSLTGQIVFKDNLYNKRYNLLVDDWVKGKYYVQFKDESGAIIHSTFFVD